jgi:ribonuclease HI
MRVTIYSDGGSDPNPGIGGWAAILQAGEHEKVLTGNDPSTTNNRMELQAAVAALEALNRPSEIDFYTDSEYLRMGITTWIVSWEASGWKRKGKTIRNRDLWQKLATLVQDHEIEWHWVKGHSGNPMNERVDRLARQARMELMPELELPDDVLHMYVRGTCRGNPGPGAWAVVIETDGDTEQFSGSVPRTTNNRMELIAVLEGMRQIDSGSSVLVITTSDYVYMGATKWIHGWRQRDWKKRDGKPISNQDLWMALEELQDAYLITWRSAKGQVEKYLGLQEAGNLATETLKLETL